MIDSTTYTDSKNRKEIVPQITLNKFDDPKDEWSFYNKMEILLRATEQYTGNMKHNVVSGILLIQKYY